MKRKSVFARAVAAFAAVALVLVTSSIASAGPRGGGGHFSHGGGMRHSTPHISKHIGPIDKGPIRLGERRGFGKLHYIAPRPPGRGYHDPRERAIGRAIEKHGFVNADKYFARRAIGKAISEHRVIKPHHPGRPYHEPDPRKRIIGRAIAKHGFVNADEYFARRAIGKAISKHRVIKPHYTGRPYRDPYKYVIGRTLLKHGFANADDYFARRSLNKALANGHLVGHQPYHPSRPAPQ